MAKLFLFFLRENDERQKVYAFFKCKLYLVKGLKTNILIENNILITEGFVIDDKLNHAILESCGVKITIRVRQKDSFLKRKLFAENNGMVLPRSKAIIFLLPILLSDDRNFLFHPIAQANLTLFAYIIDHETTKILVRNTFDWPLRISHHQKLGHTVNIHYHNYFLAKAKSALHATIFLSKASFFFEYESFCIPIFTNLFIETRWNNGIRIYRDK